MQKQSRSWKIMFSVFVVLSIVVFTGCKKTTLTAPSAEEETGDSSMEEDQVSEPDTEEVEVPDPAAPPLAAPPMRIQFTAEDGQELVGHYFAAASNPAPTVILLHW